MDLSAHPTLSGPNLHSPESYHRVYLLSCAHCGCFVSDRGMKAVLLLRPSITLFSTDGMPYNCGPIYQDGLEDGSGASESIERTCDCLTQSMGCYGCGNTIGYHIICPCSRCVDSVSRHRQAANGHRWVFHYGEVTFQERCYVDDEPGVYNAHCVVNPHLHRSSSSCRRPNSPSSGPSNPSSSSSSLSSFSADDASTLDSRDRDQSKPDSGPYETDSLRPSQGLHDIRLSSINPNFLRVPAIRSSSNQSFQVERSLKPGDPVYWHHLISGGERPLPVLARPTPRSRPAR